MRSTRGRYRVMLAVVGVVALAVLAGAVALWPRGELPKPGAGGQNDSTRLVSATLTKVARVDCPEADPGVPGSVCIRVTAQLAGGRQVAFDTTDPTGGMFRAGQRVRLAVTEQPGSQPLYYIQDLERGRPLLVLAVLFVLAVVAFGRWQGIRSLVGLGLSFVVIVSFVVPAILHGHSPVLVAVTGAMAIMLISLYLSHGTGPKTTAAVVGTALALGLTAALAIAFVAAASLTGLASEEALSANFAVGGLSLRGLLLAGIIIGGLGVLDDVTMSQASLVAELHAANPTAGFAALVGAALRVGRDHIAATVNTLFLAYAGAALPALILFVTGQDSLGTVVTAELVAVEVVRALCGSVGLIAAVPLTTVLAALVATEEPAPGQTHATTGARPAPEAEIAPPADATTKQGRSGWGLARGLSQEQAALVWDRVLAVHGPHLSHAIVEVDNGAWLTAEELPAEVKTAASRLRQLAADAQR
ncbi:MAG TPA: YibE/F family protein, partial [Actinomycetota bacterium]|nr:YibE/F family protein [Actinomycetota bacterium]